MPPRAHRRPITKAEVLAYGRLLEGTKAHPKVGATCTLQGKRVAVLDIINSELARVRFESGGHIATVHLNLLES